MTIKALSAREVPNAQIARMLGVTHKRYPPPPLRSRRLVETPARAQSQVD